MRSTRPLGCSKMRLRKLGRSRERRARQPAGRRSLVAAAVRAFSSHMPARRLRARRKGRSDSVIGRRFLPALSRDTSFGSSSAGTEPLARPWLGNSSSRDVFRRLRCCDGLPVTGPYHRSLTSRVCTCSPRVLGVLECGQPKTLVRFISGQSQPFQTVLVFVFYIFLEKWGVVAAASRLYQSGKIISFVGSRHIPFLGANGR